MKTLYTITKEKTNIKGFWQDKNKIYIDNIKQKECTEQEKQKLFLSGEICIFYTSENEAFIEYQNNKIDVLRVKRIIHYKHINKTLIKELLNNFNGFTVYKNKTFKDYTIKIWQ